VLWLLKAMFKEEFRLQSSYSNRWSTMMFPMMLCVMSFILAVSLPKLQSAMSMKQMLMGVHLSALLYGIVVGGFAFLGREMLERRWGQATFLLSSAQTLPITFRRTFLAFFLKDTLYYIFITLLPVTLGLALSIPITHFHAMSVLALFGSLTLTFVYGISFAFFMSAIYTRSRRVFMGLTSAVVVLVLASAFLHLFGVGFIAPSIEFWASRNPWALLASAALSFAWSSWAVMLVEERFESPSVVVKGEYETTANRFAWFGRLSPYLAKEWTDLVRSRTLSKITLAFILPLAVLSAFDWFLEKTLSTSIQFTSIFYGGMVGFFGVLIYSWLNNIDYVEYYSTFPVVVSDIVRAKLIMFVLLTSGISTGFVVGMSALHGEWARLPVALLVMFSTSIYMVVVTAYLTGLRTNVYLFDTRILTKFAFLSIVPLMAVTFLSMAEERLGWLMLLAIAVVCLVLATATRLLLGRLDLRWRGETFTISG
jgi:hypothetical protein